MKFPIKTCIKEKAIPLAPYIPQRTATENPSLNPFKKSFRKITGIKNIKKPDIQIKKIVHKFLPE